MTDPSSSLPPATCATPVSPDALAGRVKARARELGFDLVGIASAEPFPEDEARTLAWLHRGFNAGMAWITAERTHRATHPAELLTGARSLVVVGARYGGEPDCPLPLTRPPRAVGATPAQGVGALPAAGEAEPRGRVARYARGADYHAVVRRRLDALAADLRVLGGPETRTRPFVDSSPLPERAAAVRAGLGFVGKNTNLLTASAGSWVLLAALLTTLDLAPDTPVERDCGRCRLCLDACPTGAFPAPYVVDANRCISYLTIEHRGPIPPELRPGIGAHVFGCDVCQDVCPWNRADRGPGWTELAGDGDAAAPRLADLLTLDAEAFRARYRHTPLWRTKRRGLLRNAAVALGNTGGPSDLPVLTAALHDPEPLVRGHAAWAIGRIGAAAGRASLESALGAEEDAEVRAEIRAALASLA